MITGILFAILTGLSWVVSGAVVGLAEKRGCGTSRQQLVGGALKATITLAVLTAGVALRPGAAAFSLRSDMRSFLWMVLCGFMNYWGAVCMGRAMLRGPNGIVWTIVQSGFVFPFALGVALGNTPLTVANAAGAVCVLVGVAFCGRAKGGAAGRRPAARTATVASQWECCVAGPVRQRPWLLAAFAGFALCGATQCAQCLAAMGPHETRPSALLRILFELTGAFCAIIPHRLWLWRRNRAIAAPVDPDLGAKYRFLLKICSIHAVIFFTAGFWWLYNALDRLEAAGLIAVANPLMLASCLVGFTIYGAVALRERPSRAQLLGTLFALAGIALIAAPSFAK